MRGVGMGVTAVLLLCGGWLTAAEDAAEEYRLATEHWRKGRYEEAREAFEALPDSEPLVRCVGLVRIDLETGRVADAAKRLAEAVNEFPDEAALLAWQAHIAFERGDWDLAKSAGDAALKRNPDELRARLVLARWLTETGDLKKADEAWRWFVRYYNRAQPKEADDLLLVAEGSLQYARWHASAQIFDFVLNTLCTDALKADPLCWPARALGGALLIEKYNNADAAGELREALAINPHAVPVLIVRADAAAQEYDWDLAERFAGEALKTWPEHPTALGLLADAKTFAGDLPAAIALAERARANAPRSQRVLGRLAGLYLLQDGPPPRERLDDLLSHADHIADLKLDKPSRFEAIVLEAAGRNPHAGEFFTQIGMTVEFSRKLDLVERFLRTATVVMPQLAQPKNELGMLYLQMGRTEDARRLLDAAFKADPYHVRVSNMRKVLKVLEGYGTVSTDHFVVRYDTEQDKVLARYLSEYLESIYPELTAQFGFEPEARTQFEIYSSTKGQSAHEWFSARMTGMPWIQTVGASTGMIVAMASPNALDEPFNWARVARHEFVHVLTLQQTGFNIPHWFTEALAVRSEGYPMPASWEEALKERVPRRDLRTLDNLNLGFIRAKNQADWNFAYCQSACYADYLVERFGKDALPKLLDAYRRNLTTDRALREVFKTEPAEFEQGYLAFLDRLVASLPGDQKPPAAEAEDLEAAYEKSPDDPDVAGRYAGHLLKQRKREEARKIAEATLEKAPHQAEAALVMAALAESAGFGSEVVRILEAALDDEHPQRAVLQPLILEFLKAEEFERADELAELGQKHFPAERIWLELLARTTARTKRVERQKAVLDRLALLEADDADYRRTRAEIAVDERDFERAATFARMALEIDVLDPQVHWLLAKSHLGLGRTAEARKEFGVLVEMKPDGEGWEEKIDALRGELAE